MGSFDENTEVDGTALEEAETFHTFGCDVPGKNPDTPDFLTPLLDENGEEIRVTLTNPIDKLGGEEFDAIVPDIPPELAEARFITEVPITRLPDGIPSPAPDGRRDFLLFRCGREFFTGELQLDDGEMEYWGFEDPDLPLDGVIGEGAFSHLEGGPFPSQRLFLLEGSIFQVTLKAKKNTHTIHWHGIEPTTFNDGVGHTSFEVSGSYTYQWYVSQPGGYLYHCHKNTTLHFEMGMAGALVAIPEIKDPDNYDAKGHLILDPPPRVGPLLVPSPDGASLRRVLYQLNPDSPPEGDPDKDLVFDTVILYAATSSDLTWHELGHSVGLCGDDVGLNDYNPTVFTISGDPNPQPIFIRPGIALLLPVANGSFTVLRCTFGLDVEVAEVDGRQFGGQTSLYSHRFSLPKDTPFEINSAQRFNLYVQKTEAGIYPVTFEFLHWITGTKLGTIETAIIVV